MASTSDDPKQVLASLLVDIILFLFLSDEQAIAGCCKASEKDRLGSVGRGRFGHTDGLYSHLFSSVFSKGSGHTRVHHIGLDSLVSGEVFH